MRKLFRFLETAWIPITLLKALIVSLVEKTDCILTTSDAPHIHFLSTAYCLSKITGKKLVLYLLDPVEAFGLGNVQKMLVKTILPRALRHAAHIIVMSDILADYYHKQYGIQCDVLPHPVAIHNNDDAETLYNDTSNGQEVNIVFSGKVSRFQEDSLINLRNAIDLISGNYKIKMFTSTSHEYLKQRGFDGVNVSMGYITHEELKEELKKADILFIPLSFTHGESIIVKAAFPAKTMDYLLASRPILINAPKDTYIVQYASKDKWAVCVTENNAAALADAIRDLVNDKTKRLNLIHHGKKALKLHDAKVINEKFEKIICPSL
jgi:glycosyltransferase involved in cell wall biosynthesis